MPNIGFQEIVVVLIIALVIFGPRKLPELGRSLGRGIREFRESISGHDDDAQPPSQLGSGDTAGGDAQQSGHETTTHT